ncbi:DNA ligase D [Paraconexibacter antarcticus]|uniref:DNA ligase (ATP) n=1 Tax=Paraconexibacter antarcticus TaxID=2949664 RepID=A0ABY5DMC7_9ACTN|nr:DNA ligase D [Paraconexibacter antarcticus]UTI62726.1 DNA ligase D [Paraconexibacter antarcticus]
MPRRRDLQEYDAKRDFGRTPEPSGGEAADGGAAALRFVVQEHSATRLHWDLRLERDGVLVSFALPGGLPVEPGENHLAVRTEDHPLRYLDFHGEIPKGNYGAGTMTIFDTGTYDVLKWEEGRKIEVHLHGTREDARFALFPIAKKPSGPEWMIHRMDPPADPGAEAMPATIAPMLAQLAKALPPKREQDRWAFEVKWDGVRAVCHSVPGRLGLRSRAGNDITAQYSELARLNRALGHHRVILDGEIVVLGPDGRPSFGALQQRMHVTKDAARRRHAKESPVTYMIFDLLWQDGHPLTGRPYLERREALAALGLADERWKVPEHVVGHGDALLAAAKEQRLEGIIAKRLDSTYEAGRRTGSWRKHKLLQRETFVIGGWVPGEGRRRERIGALLIGVRDAGGGLRSAGRVGTGFGEVELERLAGLLGPLEQEDSPFVDAERGRSASAKIPRTAVFVRPELSCEVEFLERTATGQVRAPSYKGLAEAAAGGAVDGPAPADVRLSNPAKVLYPATGFTKRDLVDYYVQIADVLLPHLRDRRLTLKRYPDGVEGDFFYEKNAPSHRPQWVTTAGGYVVADSPAALAWLGNLADLELHTPMARADDMARPAILAFDLDPGPGAGLAECCTVALWLRAMLDGLGLRSWPKTSGSKGMQLYVPLNHPGATYAGTKGLARTIAQLLAKEAPELVVDTQKKSAREGRVLIDWSQNDEHKTTVCVYSPRATPRPQVSTPLHWAEVEAGDADALVFSPAEVLERVEREGDLFAEVATLVQALPAS